MTLLHFKDKTVIRNDLEINAPTLDLTEYNSRELTYIDSNLDPTAYNHWCFDFSLVNKLSGRAFATLKETYPLLDSILFINDKPQPYQSNTNKIFQNDKLYLEISVKGTFCIVTPTNEWFSAFLKNTKVKLSPQKETYTTKDFKITIKMKNIKVTCNNITTKFPRCKHQTNLSHI